MRAIDAILFEEALDRALMAETDPIRELRSKANAIRAWFVFTGVLPIRFSDAPELATRVIARNPIAS